MSEVERDCGLILDEMSLDEAIEYCASSKQLIGPTTLPPSELLATKALVVMLVGIAERWKQVVAYQLTKASIPAGHMKEFVLSIIEKAECIGLHIHFVTSDSGSENQRMWRDMGLDFSHENILKDLSLVHPIDENRTLEIVPDPVHVFKNCVNGWINNEFLVLPKWYVQQNSLSTDVVHRDHLKALVDFESGNQLRMAYGLSATDVAFHLPKSSVDKMKVCNATKYCNRTVAAGLRVLASEQGRPELLPTACFIEDMTIWFEVINNRSEDSTLCRTDSTFHDVISRLQHTARLIYDVRVAEKGRWKPWKTGLVLCTNAIIRLTTRFLANGHRKIFTSRFVQDCLESLFSVVRAKQRRPTPQQFARNLKAITISQYMAPVPNSSYEYDDQEHLLGMADFLLRRRQEKRKTVPPVQLDTCDNIDVDYKMLLEAADDLDRGELNALFYISGYIIRSLSRRTRTCKQCMDKLVSKNGEQCDFQSFTHYRRNASKKDFCVPSVETFNFFKAMEILYRNSKNCLTSNASCDGNIEQMLISELELLPNLFHCSRFKTTLIRRYVSFRLKSGEERKQRKKKFDSRSMLS